MKFGKLTVIKPVKTKNSKYTQWLCRCDCGNEAVAYSYKLLAGRVKSCGCLMTNIHPYKALKQENAELKAENEILKSQLDFEVQKKEVFEIENERLKFKLDTVEADYEASEIEVKDLKSEITFLRTVNDHLSQLDYYRRKTNKTLQGIKKIAETCTSCGDCGCAISQMSHILDLITKAEGE